MSRRTIAIAAALSVLAVGSPLIAVNANPLATQYYDQGLEKYEARNYQGAIDDFNKAIEIDPQDALAYYFRGSSRELTNDREGDCDDWRESLDLGEANAAEYVELIC